MIIVNVRYFAGAAEAAGAETARYSGAPEATLDSVLRGRTERLDRVLDVATLLANGARVDGSTPLADLGGDEVTVDVLPPFAGG